MDLAEMALQFLQMIPGVKVKARRDDDVALPEGEPSVFTDMDEALELEEMQEKRLRMGCQEAHILLYYLIHQERLVDQWNVESERFMAGQCQECGSSDGYQESDERCTKHRIKEDNEV